ncbi:MAG: hypothetical protein MUF87_20000 [Anaerolineae bacterium]|jgi:hypothetical protein|nr:hypothetical protein [Anaerolineae bacterium]
MPTHDLIPKADPKFQQRLEDELIARLREEQDSPMALNSVPLRAKSKSSLSLPLVAALLAVIGVGVVFSQLRSSQEQALTQVSSPTFTNTLISTPTPVLDPAVPPVNFNMPQTVTATPTFVEGHVTHLFFNSVQQTATQFYWLYLTATPPMEVWPESNPYRPVLLARRNLPAGTILSRDQFFIAYYPASLVPNDPNPLDPTTFEGRVLRSEIGVYQPLSNSLFEPRLSESTADVLPIGTSTLVPRSSNDSSVEIPITLISNELPRSGSNFDILALTTKGEELQIERIARQAFIVRQEPERGVVHILVGWDEYELLHLALLTETPLYLAELVYKPYPTPTPLPLDVRQMLLPFDRFENASDLNFVHSTLIDLIGVESVTSESRNYRLTRLLVGITVLGTDQSSLRLHLEQDEITQVNQWLGSEMLLYVHQVQMRCSPLLPTPVP